MAVDFVRLEHPETGGAWDCPNRAVDAWQEKGWRRVETDKTTSARRRGNTAEEKSNG